jgi:2'-5' RNA ligase
MHALETPTARLFFGLPVDGALDRHFDTLVKGFVDDAQGRAVPAENLHATLAFLGSVPRDALCDLRSIGAALPRAGFGLVLDTVGSFQGARVAWIGPSQRPGALLALHEALTERLREDGYRVEARPYLPHVTVARHCHRALATRTIAPIAWPVTRIVLYESITAAGGPRYEPRASYALERA